MDIECFEFDLRLADGTLYRVVCSREDMDKLMTLIGEKNLADCEEL